MTDPLAALTDINLNDLVAAFGWQRKPVLAYVLRRIFYGPARKFAVQMLEFDRLIAQCGLPEAARSALGGFVHNVELFGLENLSKTGPTLYLSNHPGMADTLSLFAAIARPDLRILALDRPFLKSLENVSKQLFYLSDDPHKRTDAVKKATTHLRNGGAVLTFPAGAIEPDPDVLPGALDSLKDWTNSAGVFLRFAPGTTIAPVLVRCVVWDKAIKHPLTLLRATRKDREWLGTSLQLLSSLMFNTRPVTARVQFARPIDASQVDAKDLASIHEAVLGRMRGLIQEPPQEKGLSVL